MPSTISIPNTLSSITKHWSPHLVGTLNDSAIEVKVAKIAGSFIWHSHPDSDELFYVLKGALVVEIEGGEDAHMGQGDLFVVPKGVRHRPVSEGGAEIMLIEAGGVVNTGDAGTTELTNAVKDARGIQGGG